MSGFARICAGVFLLIVALGCEGETATAPTIAVQMGGSVALPTGGTAGPGDVPLGGESAPAAPGPGASAGMEAQAPEGGTGAPPADTPATSAFCDALGVVRQQCQGCHGESLVAGAPMPLVSYADMVAPAVSDPSRTVSELMAVRIHETQTPMPPRPAMLAVDEMAALDRWVEGGALPGPDPTCPGLPAAPVEDDTEFVWPEGCERYTMTIPAHRVPANSETHPQFTFDAPWGDDPVQMLAYQPITDNERVVHHWILYSGGGLAGFGSMLLSFSQGKYESPQLPDNVGLYFPSGRESMHLDMHYYNLGNSEDVVDSSGLEVCVTKDFRPVTASELALAASATVPANQRVSNTSSCTVSVTPGTEAHFISVGPHMHKLGVHSKLELTRNGMTTTLLDEPFTFTDQNIYPMDNLLIQDGDVLTTTCTFENNTSRLVQFGQNADDEMCFNFVLYYPMDEVSCTGGSFFF